MCSNFYHVYIHFSSIFMHVFIMYIFLKLEISLYCVCFINIRKNSATDRCIVFNTFSPNDCIVFPLPGDYLICLSNLPYYPKGCFNKNSFFYSWAYVLTEHLHGYKYPKTSFFLLNFVSEK